MSQATTKINENRTFPPPSNNCRKYEVFEIWIGTMNIPIKAHRAKRINQTEAKTNRKGISLDLSV